MEIDEGLEVEYCSDMIFDFSEFLDQQLNVDCRLILLDDNHTQFHCHRIILSSASGFFQNVFTSGMEEEKTADVKITCNPLNLFPEVLKFLYTSIIDINDDNIMAIFEIAYFYNIQILEEKIKDIMASKDSSKIMEYTKFCYENELKDSLNFLIPYMAFYYKEIPINVFSDNLDTTTFCKVLRAAIKDETFSGNTENEIKTFLNGETPSKEEAREINNVINNYYPVS